MYKIITPAGLGLAAMTGFAFGEEGSSRFSSEFVFEIENDYLFDSTNPDNELNDTFLTLEGALSYEIADGFSINTTLLFEPVEDADGDRFIEDHGLFAEELFLHYENDTVALTLGKFNPAFGFAWDLAPGIFGVDFAEDYEITERLGAAVAIPFSFAGGEHAVSVSFFGTDRTFLSESLVENRGRVDLDDGGVGNTEGPASFVVSVAGEIGSTAYNFGVQSQAASDTDDADQVGVVLGAVKEFDSFGTPIEVLGELVYFDDFDGGTESAVFATAGVAVPVGRVTLSAVYTLRDIQGADADHLATVSAELELIEGLTASIGYRYADEEGDENNTFGTLLVYEF